MKADAYLNGTIAFSPQRWFHGNGFTLTSGQWLKADNVSGGFTDVMTTLAATTTDNGNLSYMDTLGRQSDAYSQYAGNDNARHIGQALDAVVHNPALALEPMIAVLDFSAPDGVTIRAALPLLSGETYASASGVLLNCTSATRSSVNNRLSQAFGGNAVNPVSILNFAQGQQKSQAASAMDQVTPQPFDTEDLHSYVAWGTAFGSWTSQSGTDNAARTKSTLGGFISGIDGSVYDNWRLGIMAGYNRSTFKTADLHSSGTIDNYTLGAYTGTAWNAGQGLVGLRTGFSYSWHNIEMSRKLAFNSFSDNLSADYHAGTFQAFGELRYKHNLTERSVIEPYANLAYMHLKSSGFTEKGYHGAALAVKSNTMDTTLSMLGMRVLTNVELGNIIAIARADLGWRHAFGGVIPTSTASFAAGSNSFVSTGNSIGRDTALIETGLDFAITKSSRAAFRIRGSSAQV